MYEGLIIRYKVSPFFNMPIEWVTEITHVRELEYFVDNQLKGPFNFWHHQHFFKEITDGIEMHDIVNYELPFGKIGEIVGLAMVRTQIIKIFSHRRVVIEKQFGEK